jgi:hypothetical protein
MRLVGLPKTYEQWLKMRYEHLDENLVAGNYTKDLFKQYKKHLGSLRYAILIEVQKLIAPKKVKELLNFGNMKIISPVLGLYKFSRKLKLDWFFKIFAFTKTI